MDGWLDGWIDGWIDGWTDRLQAGQKSFSQGRCPCVFVCCPLRFVLILIIATILPFQVATATDEQVQSLNVAPLELSISAAGLLLLQEHHAQLEAASKQVVRKMAEVIDEADGLVKSGHYASAEIKRLRKSLGQRVGRMARIVLQRREVLGHGVKFQKKANEVCCFVAHPIEKWTDYFKVMLE